MEGVKITSLNPLPPTGVENKNGSAILNSLLARAKGYTTEMFCFVVNTDDGAAEGSSVGFNEGEAVGLRVGRMEYVGAYVCDGNNTGRRVGLVDG